jgi:hypothetical protein
MVPVARFELRKQHSYYGADGEDRTPNLLITNQLPYHWATSALVYLPSSIKPVSGFGRFVSYC